MTPERLKEIDAILEGDRPSNDVGRKAIIRELLSEVKRLQEREAELEDEVNKYKYSMS